MLPWCYPLDEKPGSGGSTETRPVAPFLAGRTAKQVSNHSGAHAIPDDAELIAEVQRALTAIRIEAERLAGQVRALETIIERYGQSPGE